MAPGDGGVSVAREDDLALLGHLESARHRSGRLGTDSAIGGTATASQGSASSMKHGQAHAPAPGPGSQVRLGFVKREGCGQRPDLLGRVGIAQHHLQSAAGFRQPALDGRERKHLLHHVWSLTQVIHRLKQRDDVEHRRIAAGRVIGQLVHGGNVADVSGEADDVAPARFGAEPCLDAGDRADGVEHLTSQRGHLSVRADLGQRTCVDMAVLSHLERGEMKPERLRLPDQMLQLAVGLAWRARACERALDAAQVGEQLV